MQIWLLLTSVTFCFLHKPAFWSFKCQKVDFFCFCLELDSDYFFLSSTRYQQRWPVKSPFRGFITNRQRSRPIIITLEHFRQGELVRGCGCQLTGTINHSVSFLCKNSVGEQDFASTSEQAHPCRVLSWYYSWLFVYFFTPADAEQKKEALPEVCISLGVCKILKKKLEKVAMVFTTKTK